MACCTSYLPQADVSMSSKPLDPPNPPVCSSHASHDMKMQACVI